MSVETEARTQATELRTKSSRFFSLDPLGDFYYEHITAKKLPMATQESPAPLQGTEKARPQLKSQ